MEIAYRAAQRTHAIISSLGRTEDVRFSPDNRRLAIAAFNQARIALFDVEIATSAGTPEVSLTGGLEISSSCLRYPHGLDFLDDGTLVVASRQGDVAIFKLPSMQYGAVDLAPIQVLRAATGATPGSPGSVAAVAGDEERCDLLICSNSRHNVTRHLVDRPGYAMTDEGVLLQRWLNLPDSIGVSDDHRWIAISNHNTHNVLLYDWSKRLDAASKPDGVLRGLYFPHGLRFTADGRHLLVADAGAPLVHVYARGGEGWHGTRYPARSVRVMDDGLYLRGRVDPQEGGPKGIDLDRGMNVLVATSEHQPLLFLDLPALLRDLPAAVPAENVEYEFGILQQAERLRKKVHDAEARAAKAEYRLHKHKAKAKWLPKPLRRLYSAWRLAN
jgi:DNA-binding beta-propeller fold protein YncE